MSELERHTESLLQELHTGMCWQRQNNLAAWRAKQAIGGSEEKKKKTGESLWRV